MYHSHRSRHRQEASKTALVLDQAVRENEKQAWASATWSRNACSASARSYYCVVSAWSSSLSFKLSKIMDLASMGIAFESFLVSHSFCKYFQSYLVIQGSKSSMSITLCYRWHVRRERTPLIIAALAVSLLPREFTSFAEKVHCSCASYRDA